MPLRQSPNLASKVSGSGTFRRYGIPQMSATTGSGSVVLTEGNASNIKITTPIDLAVAEIVLKG